MVCSGLASHAPSAVAVASALRRGRRRARRRRASPSRVARAPPSPGEASPSAASRRARAATPTCTRRPRSSATAAYGADQSVSTGTNVSQVRNGSGDDVEMTKINDERSCREEACGSISKRRCRQLSHIHEATRNAKSYRGLKLLRDAVEQDGSCATINRVQCTIASPVEAQPASTSSP